MVADIRALVFFVINRSMCNLQDVEKKILLDDLFNIHDMRSR